MKKRILSILLAMCMLMSLLPVAAFAAAYEAPTNVTPAILHDTRDANAGGIADEDLVAADSYKVTCEEPASADIGVNHVIKLVATDLKRHRNGDSPENMGYWAGVAIAAPEGATHMKAVAKLSTESLGTAFESAQVREVTPNITADNKGGFVQYLDVSAEAYKAGVFYVKLQWYTDASTAVANSTATVYKVDFSGVKLAPAAIDKVGFCAVGNDANDEVDAIIKSYGRPSGIANRDSDRNTMYIAMTDLDVSGKTYYTVKITDPDGTVLSTNDKNGNKTLSGTIDCRNYTGTENFSVLRITLNPTNRADNGAYVVTTAGDTTPYVMKAGDYKVELYTSATADGELTKIDTETITLNTVTVKDKAGEVADTIFAAKGGTVKAPAAPAADTGYAFKHWSDGTKTYAPEAAVTVTGNITLTPVFERIVAKSVTATADNATLVATPTTDLTADPVTGKITITGAATTPTGDGTTVTLAITPSVGAVETKTFKLKYENETLSADPVQVTIAGINYTIDVSDIT
ncbi:MAG: hypothetical protein HFF00_03545 [Ruminiclostridium sp.]|nr:hypothetical protein [Ruminiclostridium sp.]